MPRRRRGELTEEDRRLWSQVAASAEPLDRRKPAVPAAPAEAPLPPKPHAAAKPAAHQAPPPRPPLAAFRVGQNVAAVARPATYTPAPDAGARLAAQPPAMDHKTHRRMVRGRLSPEARIDLHGMTLAVAQPVLERFVLAQREAGRRLVLVITGKGRSVGPDAPLPVRPGALRHFVPIWLHRAPLAGAVLQVTPAHLRHGGEGAFYVYLRR